MFCTAVMCRPTEIRDSSPRRCSPVERPNQKPNIGYEDQLWDQQMLEHPLGFIIRVSMLPTPNKERLRDQSNLRLMTTSDPVQKMSDKPQTTPLEPERLASQQQENSVNQEIFKRPLQSPSADLPVEHPPVSPDQIQMLKNVQDPSKLDNLQEKNAAGQKSEPFEFPAGGQSEFEKPSENVDDSTKEDQHQLTNPSMLNFNQQSPIEPPRAIPSTEKREYMRQSDAI